MSVNWKCPLLSVVAMRCIGTLPVPEAEASETVASASGCFVSASVTVPATFAVGNVRSRFWSFVSEIVCRTCEPRRRRADRPSR